MKGILDSSVMHRLSCSMPSLPAYGSLRPVIEAQISGALLILFFLMAKETSSFSPASSVRLVSAFTP
jgi:hypothetical protein